MREAIPTDYLNVRYRSRSEALFAAFLDGCGFRFQYEPAWLEVDGWTPDFAFFSHQVFGRRVNGGELAGVVIEYKPSEPSSSYLNQLGGRFTSMADEAPFELIQLCIFGSCHQSSDPSQRSALLYDQRGSFRDISNPVRLGSAEVNATADGWYILAAFIDGGASRHIDNAFRFAQSVRFDLA